MTMPTIPKRKVPLEGGGPVGCGCGSLLGFAFGLVLFLRYGDIGFLFAFLFALAIGAISWVFGDRFFEKALRGDPDGKPMRLWPF